MRDKEEEGGEGGRGASRSVCLCVCGGGGGGLIYKECNLDHQTEGTRVLRESPQAKDDPTPRKAII